MAVIAKDLFSIVHYEYGEAYYGSYEMMCYRVAREPLENVHFTPPEKAGAGRSSLYGLAGALRVCEDAGGAEDSERFRVLPAGTERNRGLSESDA